MVSKFHFSYWAIFFFKNRISLNEKHILCYAKIFINNVRFLNQNSEKVCVFIYSYWAIFFLKIAFLCHAYDDMCSFSFPYWKMNSKKWGWGLSNWWSNFVKFDAIWSPVKSRRGVRNGAIWPVRPVWGNKYYIPPNGTDQSNIRKSDQIGVKWKSHWIKY